MSRNRTPVLIVRDCPGSISESSGRRVTYTVGATTERMDCTYCGCDAEAHDPVYVSEDDPDAEPSAFCNYGCLSAHVEAENLAVGTTCNVEI